MNQGRMTTAKNLRQATFTALMEGPSSLINGARDAGPRLLEITAEMRFLASARATFEPRAPEPMIPTLTTFLLLKRGRPC